ncbi:MAG: 50S ribosomal protein L5 [Candidatus Burarchaeum sp.]|nr:50S ribosomal protein L5 [Candidatus Burarchaeum sp.]MDO8339372.1 50S ribosomal protein L5 [Candidatus Burarchaeum sp.]
MSNEKNANAGQNAMRGLAVEKLTLNIGVGGSGQPLENAKSLLKKITGRIPATTYARDRNPVFKLRKGDAIGAKVTLRRAPAVELLKRGLECIGRRLSSRSFDRRGNFAFGIREYIDFPGIKYDPQIGMMGFEIAVTMKRKGGERVLARRRGRVRPRRSYAVTKEESIEFVKNMFNVEVV